MKSQFYHNLNRIRIGVQFVTIVFLFAVPVLNRLGVHWIMGTLYSTSIGELDMADPVMALQTILLTRQIYLPLLIAAILPIVLALIFGRVFCSWMCPQNTISEWVDAFQKRYFRNRWRKAHAKIKATNPAPVIFWSMFAALLVLMLIFGFPLLSYLSMPGIISSQFSQGILGMGIGPEIGLVVLIVAIEFIFTKRVWCKYLCPVGAGLSMFRTNKTLQLQHREALCNCKGDAEPCHDVCPLNLSPKRPGIYPHCFNCGLCISVCEKTGYSALSFGFGKNGRRLGIMQYAVDSKQ